MDRKPFFARYLENQELATVGGGSTDPDQTMKYPSDSEDVVPDRPPLHNTRKYPSDTDEP